MEHDLNTRFDLMGGGGWRKLTIVCQTFHGSFFLLSNFKVLVLVLIIPTTRRVKALSKSDFSEEFSSKFKLWGNSF